MKPIAGFLAGMLLCVQLHPQSKPFVTEAKRKELNARVLSLTTDDFLRLAPEAEDGDTEAQFVLGAALSFGTKAINKDIEVGSKWLERAAASGYAPAQTAYARLLLSGPSGSRDTDKGLQMLRSAANQKYASAMARLGDRYMRGAGVAVDYEQGLDLLRAAMDQRHPLGYLYLAFAYGGGTGVTKDLGQAQNLLRICAGQGDAECQFWLGAYLDNGWGSPVDHTAAVDWLLKSALQDNAEAQFQLGVSYLNGEGIRRNVNEGERWLLKSSENGYAPASFYAAKLCHRFFGRVSFRMHYACEAEYYEKAAQQGLPMGAHEFGKLLLKGELGQKDPEAAFKWFLLAEELAKEPLWANSRPEEFAEMRKKLPQDKERARTKLTEQQVSRLRAEAGEWLKKNQR